MSDGDLLLNAILNDPADDTPRLAYADWLQEHDQVARAEFIRLQIGLAATGRRSAHDHAKQVRCNRLLSENFRAWLPAWYDGGDEDRGHGTFVRGFIDELNCSADCWLAHGDEVHWSHPVRKVTITTPFPIAGPAAEYDVNRDTPEFNRFYLWNLGYVCDPGDDLEVGVDQYLDSDVPILLPAGALDACPRDHPNGAWVSRYERNTERTVVEQIVKKRWPGVAFEFADPCGYIP